MRHGKKPTKAQREFLRSYNLIPEDWLITKNTSTEMELISRFTGRKKIIPKWSDKNEKAY